MRLVSRVVLPCCVSVALCLFTLASSADAADVIRADTRQFTIPVWVERAQRPNIKELQLFVSADQGKTWTQVASLPPDAAIASGFRFEAPGDGTYWFSSRIVNNDYIAELGDMHSPRVELKVQVCAGEPKSQKATANVQELKAEAKLLRQRLKQIRMRLSEIEKVKRK
ncbi:MAG: hypothetical protein H6822_24875 [Planctomycetaceae bacterium]|nr:hypothetical protein [Planctomycetales bacterium]MCB9925411.1 hypothetical protein [Planctomycetaceae bacterium]